MNLDELQERHNKRLKERKRRGGQFVIPKSCFVTGLFFEKPILVRLKKHIVIGDMVGQIK